MSNEIISIEISIVPIANGLIGNVTVRHGDYDSSATVRRYFPTLPEAISTLSTFALDPDNIIAAHPPSGDHPF